MNMDNFSIDVTGRGPGVALAVRLAYLGQGNKTTATHWATTKNGPHPKLILFWSDPGQVDSYPFPTPLTDSAMIPFIEEWLSVQDYGQQPELDGSCSKGWRITNGDSHTNGWSYQFLTVQPVWAQHHK